MNTNATDAHADAHAHAPPHAPAPVHAPPAHVGARPTRHPQLVLGGSASAPVEAVTSVATSAATDWSANPPSASAGGALSVALLGSAPGGSGEAAPSGASEEDAPPSLHALKA